MRDLNQWREIESCFKSQGKKTTFYDGIYVKLRKLESQLSSCWCWRQVGADLNHFQRWSFQKYKLEVQMMNGSRWHNAPWGHSTSLALHVCLKANDSHSRVHNGAKLYLNRGRLSSVTSWEFSHWRKQPVDKSERSRGSEGEPWPRVSMVASGRGAGALPWSLLQKEAQIQKRGKRRDKLAARFQF